MRPAQFGNVSKLEKMELITGDSVWSILSPRLCREDITEEESEGRFSIIQGTRQAGAEITASVLSQSSCRK